VGEYFLICAMSFERTALSGFSFAGRGGALCPSSKATDFRFLDIFIVGTWRGERMERPDRSFQGDGSLRLSEYLKHVRTVFLS